MRYQTKMANPKSNSHASAVNFSTTLRQFPSITYFPKNNSLQINPRTNQSISREPFPKKQFSLISHGPWAECERPAITLGDGHHSFDLVWSTDLHLHASRKLLYARHLLSLIKLLSLTILDRTIVSEATPIKLDTYIHSVDLVGKWVCRIKDSNKTIRTTNKRQSLKSTSKLFESIQTFRKVRHIYIAGTNQTCVL